MFRVKTVDENMEESKSKEVTFFELANILLNFDSSNDRELLIEKI